MLTSSRLLTGSSKTIKVEFESKVFGGYSCLVDTNIAQTIDEALIFAVSSLYGVLETNGFVKILDLAKMRNFKIKSCDGNLFYTLGTPSKNVSHIIVADNLDSLD